MAGYTGYPELALSDAGEVDRDPDKLREEAMLGGDAGGSGQGASKIDEIVDFASSGTLGDRVLCTIVEGGT